MNLLTDEQQIELSQAVQTAAGAEVRLAVENVYRALQDAIDLRKPVCITSGRCCRFDEFGHRLFVTTMELAAFTAEVGRDQVTNRDIGGCPFQENELCQVHLNRPFGCRVFFCDETSAGWQQEQYARFHKELQRLHGELKVPYFYVEWRQALGVMGLSADCSHVVTPPGL